MTTQKDMLALLRPLERDNLVAFSIVGRFRVYRLAESPWRQSLTALTTTIAEGDGNVGALVAAARQLLTGGEHHMRAYLARYLRDGVTPRKRPGPKKADPE